MGGESRRLFKKYHQYASKIRNLKGSRVQVQLGIINNITLDLRFLEICDIEDRDLQNSQTQWGSYSLLDFDFSALYAVETLKYPI